MRTRSFIDGLTLLSIAAATAVTMNAAAADPRHEHVDEIIQEHRLHSAQRVPLSQNASKAPNAHPQIVKVTSVAKPPKGTVTQMRSEALEETSRSVIRSARDDARAALDETRRQALAQARKAAAEAKAAAKANRRPL